VPRVEVMVPREDPSFWRPISDKGSASQDRSYAEGNRASSREHDNRAKRAGVCLVIFRDTPTAPKRL
jgi:hypothetical protein